MHLPIFDDFSGVYCENTCNKHCLFLLKTIIHFTVRLTLTPTATTTAAATVIG